MIKHFLEFYTISFSPAQYLLKFMDILIGRFCFYVAHNRSLHISAFSLYSYCIKIYPIFTRLLANLLFIIDFSSSSAYTRLEELYTIIIKSIEARSVRVACYKWLGTVSGEKTYCRSDRACQGVLPLGCCRICSRLSLLGGELSYV
jgi:hypothetical protein